MSHILGLKDGSTVRQELSDLAAQLLVSPELAALIGSFDLFQGEWDASGGTFPPSGSKGQFWRVGQGSAGTVDGVTFAPSDVLIALTDDASTVVYADNWHKADYVSFAHSHALGEVAGLQEALDKKASAEQGAKADTAVQPDELGTAAKADANSLAKAGDFGRQADRPGDSPEAFSANYTGAGADKAPLAGGSVVSSGGFAFVQTGAGTVATRYPVALNNDVLEVTARFRRTSNPSDPNNHAVLLRVAWLDKDKALIGSVETLATKSDALTSSGLIELSERISGLAVEEVTAPPAGAIYACPFVQTYGEDGTTAIETLRTTEVTDLHALETADLSALIADAQAATDAANNAADLVATETLDTMADVASYTRTAGVGVISLKGGNAAHDGLGGQWAYVPAGVEVTAVPPHLLIGADGANYRQVVRRASPYVYVDSENGDDANSGLTMTVPLRTIAAVKAAAITYGDGVKVGLFNSTARSSWRESLDLKGLGINHAEIFGCGNVRLYGLPEVRGDDPITGVTWQTNVDRGDAYTNVVTYTFDYDFKLDQQALPPHLYRDGVIMTWADDLAACAAEDYSFSHDATKENITGITVHVNTGGEGTPDASGIATGHVYSHTTRTWSIRVADNSKVRLCRGINQAHDNGGINGGDNAEFDRVMAYGSPIHAMLMASGVGHTCFGWLEKDDGRCGAIILEHFRGSGGGHRAMWINSIAQAPEGSNADGFGGHTSSPADDDDRYDWWEAYDCLAYNCGINFDDVVRVRTGRCHVHEGRFRAVSGSSNVTIGATHIDPYSVRINSPGAFIDGGGLSTSGGALTVIDGLRGYGSGATQLLMLGGYANRVRNSVIVLETDEDVEVYRNTSGDFGTWDVERTVFQVQGKGNATFFYTNSAADDLLHADHNVYLGFGFWRVNGNNYLNLAEVQVGEGIDAGSLAEELTTGAELIEGTAVIIGTGWTENVDGTWDQDGTGSGGADRLQFYTPSGSPELSLAVRWEGPGTFNVTDGATVVASGLGAGVHRFTRDWVTNVSISPTGTVGSVKNATLYATKEAYSMRAIDPENRVFTVGGDLQYTGAGLLRPGVRYHEPFANLEEAEAWILSQV
ncbi:MULTISPECIES: hypothetical protein [unclassified Marinovum]|uniref:hypothetical protein n=1 Tax=unclassified Marinovum TaxID=2647166 RepID=UPI003EDB7CB3